MPASPSLLMEKSGINTPVNLCIAMLVTLAHSGRKKQQKSSAIFSFIEH